MTYYLRRLFAVVCCVFFSTYAHANKHEFISFYQTGCYDVDVTNVLRSDTATIIEMQCVQNPGDEFWPSDAPLYLSDEKQNRYPLRRTEGITLGRKNIFPLTGILKFSLTFDPLPKDVRLFDLLSADKMYPAFAFWGIHKKGQRVRSFKPVAESACYKDEFYLKPGNVTIHGRIEGYVPKDKGDTLIIYSVAHINERTRQPNYCAAVNANGEFEFNMSIENTMWLYIDGRHECIPIIVHPEDTLRISIKHWRKYNMEVEYVSMGGHDEMCNLMKAAPCFADHELTVAGGKKIRMSEIKPEIGVRKYRNRQLCSYLSWKYHLSDIESHLLLLSMNSLVDAVYVGRVNKSIKSTFTHEPGSYSQAWLQQISQSLEVEESYGFLHESNTNDYSYFVLPQQHFVTSLGDIVAVGYFVGREQRLKELERFLGQSLDDEWRKRICF